MPSCPPACSPEEVLQLLTRCIVPALADWLVLAVRYEVAELPGLRVDSSDGPRLHVAVVAHADPSRGP